MSEWAQEAMQYYRRRAALFRHRWLQAELEEDFVAECIALELAERNGSSAPGPINRSAIATRALTELRRSFRQPTRRQRNIFNASMDSSVSHKSRDDEENAPTSDDPQADVDFLVSLLDQVTAALWHVWSVRHRTKAKGTGLTVRNIAAFLGWPKSRVAHETRRLEPWLSRLQSCLASGRTAQARRAAAALTQRELNHFANGCAQALELESSEHFAVLYDCGITASHEEAREIFGAASALRLLGSARYQLNRTSARHTSLVIRTPGGTMALIEDFAALATARCRGATWGQLSGLHHYGRCYQRWLSKLDEGDLAKPSKSKVLQNLTWIEEQLSMEPMGLYVLSRLHSCDPRVAAVAP